MPKKIVSIDLEVMKAKATEAAKSLQGKAKARGELAMSKLLEKGILLSEKQLKTLQAKRKLFS